MKVGLNVSFSGTRFNLPAGAKFVTRDISKVNIMSSQGRQLKTGASVLARYM